MNIDLGMTEKELIEARKEKLATLSAMGIDSYPSETEKSENIADILNDEAKWIESKNVTTLCGRILAIRGHGKLFFVDIQDESGKIQTILKIDLMEKDFPIVPCLDLGDFLQVTGPIIKTNSGETSVEATGAKILTKSLHPLPDKRQGLKDPETKYRERYLDLLVNPEVKEKFYQRSAIVKAAREYLLQNGFMEVDTPVLQPIAGGATAKPFTTHYNAYDRDVFLRIAPELYLKRLIVGGFEKVFEFARCFRNEGVDASHNPEFTNLEFYWAYADYEKMMDFVEGLIREIVKALTGGKLTLEVAGAEIDFSKKFARKTFKEVASGGNTDEAFKSGVAKIIEPTFVTNHPTELLPLAKKNKKNPELADSFQLVICGLELCKAFSELNDPIDQKERFEDQMELKKKGDEEAQEKDDDFIKAIECGMPPTSGCGIGIDRLVRLLTGASTLREIIFFPFMKPDQQEAVMPKADSGK